MLDTVDKLTKIVLTTIAGFMIAWGGLQVKWDELGIATNRYCFDYESKASAALTSVESVPPEYVKNHARICGITEPESASRLNQQKTLEDLTASASTAITPETSAITGYVAVGKPSPGSYGQVNFDAYPSGRSALEDGALPEAGDLLRTRWSVNLRRNTSNTTLGNNPVVLVIGEGRCVRVEEAPETVRSQIWAKVSAVECTS